jgi:energy-coupling factor transporter ATP-binding protein EcfA2
MLAIACALSTDPAMLLLDEPTLGLDRAAADQLLTTIIALRRDREFGVILVEHRLPDVVAIADRVWILQHGEIVYDGATPQDANSLARLLV